VAHATRVEEGVGLLRQALKRPTEARSP
jgi:hypothetical protein